MGSLAAGLTPSLKAVERAVRDPARVRALHDTALLDTPAEEVFDRLARLATKVLRTPVSLLTLIDEDRQFFKAAVGLPEPIRVARQTPLSHSFCQHTVAGRAPLVVADARRDPVLRDNPAVSDLNVIAYLGIPLIDSTGEALGAFCVIDYEPRDWSDAEVEAVEAFASAALAEIELRRFRDAQFQQIVDHAPAAVFVKDLDGRFLLVNRCFEELAGSDRNQVIGRTAHDLFPSPLADDYAAHDRTVTETGQPLEVDEDAVLRDGLHHYVALRFPLRNADGRIYAVAGISYDITQRRRAQQERDRSLERERHARALADESRRLLADILERVTDGFVAFDRDWTYTYVNEQAGELLGHRPEELFGKNYYKEFPEAVGTPFEQAYQRAMREQVPITLEDYYEPWDRWFENRIYPSPDGLSILFSEITERKRAEGELRRLNEELERHSLELEERVQERTADLEAANRELEAFAYTVSHDLRAPLRSMEGFGRALLEDHAEALSEEGREFAGRIAGAAGRMSELIDDLLAYARLSRVELHLTTVHLSRVVADAQGQVEADLESRQARVQVVPPLPTVVGHHRTLVQIVANILSNAAKFTADGVQPRIRVRAEAIGAATRLWVEDNGIGIAPDYLEQIFRVFERLHGSESYPGTGIGLAIVRKGVERMGGRAGVDSAVGTGSRFWIELPTYTRSGRTGAA